MAIDGTVVMTTELLQDLGSIFDARVPKSWTHDASGAEISWLLPTLGSWFTGLLDRQIMLNTWLENSRAVMRSYWITGFTNAQGFLTGMRQEVTRQHKKDQWALDDVMFSSVFDDMKPSNSARGSEGASLSNDGKPNYGSMPGYLPGAEPEESRAFLLAGMAPCPRI